MSGSDKSLANMASIRLWHRRRWQAVSPFGRLRSAWEDPWFAIARFFLAVALCALAASNCFAQRMDSFEGGEPRWLLVEDDCQARLAEQAIRVLFPHGGQTCEVFDIVCSQGTTALMAYPIEPAIVLDEFQPRVWVRCASGGLQLGVRVVFPFAEHPVTHGRLHSILWGTTYTATGSWQKLEVGQLTRLFRDEVVALRQRFGADLNLDGAYIDSLTLNAYTGPGRARVQIDDLDLRGMIPMSATGIAPPANWRERWRWRYPQRRPEEDSWAVSNQPPRWLQYQGESLPWIRSLNFDGVAMSQFPSDGQLQNAKQSDLSMMVPPPAYDLTDDQGRFSVVTGWLVGAALDRRQVQSVAEEAQRVSGLAEPLRRPIVGEALEQYWAYSRIADEVIVPIPFMTSAAPENDRFEWMRQQLKTTRARGNGWISIYAEPTPAWTKQFEAASKVLTPARDVQGTPANPLSLRWQVTEAVLAGARGVLFRTFEPLEMQTPDGSARVAGLRWINHDLALWGPWLMGGQPSRSPGLNRPDYRAGAWQVSGSQLVLAQVRHPDAAVCLPPTASQPLVCTLPAPEGVREVLRVTEGRLETVPVERESGNLRWQVAEPAAVEAFVITTNPKVIGFLRKTCAEQATQNAADQLEIASYNLGWAQQLVEARYPTEAPEAPEARGDWVRLRDAQLELDRGWQALRSQQADAATGFALRAIERIQRVLFAGFESATANLPAPQSSPWILSPATLSYHWLLADACRRSQWRQLELPGSELRDLKAIERAGWRHQRREVEDAELRIEWVPPVAGRTQPGIRLAAYGRQQRALPGGYAGATLRVRSAGTAVKAGQLVRITAKLEVLKASDDPLSGLLLYDNQAGPSLGQLVRGQPGQILSAQLYRFIVDDGELRLLAECRGDCDMVLHEVTASVIEPAVNRNGFPTLPQGSTPTPLGVGKLMDLNAPEE